MNPTPTPTPTVSPTQVTLDWSAFIGPALVAAVVTAFITVWLHFRTVRREDRYRFTADKRAAYVALLAAEFDHRNAAYAMHPLADQMERLHEAFDREISGAIIQWRQVQAQYPDLPTEPDATEREASVARTLAESPRVAAMVEAGQGPLPDDLPPDRNRAERKRVMAEMERLARRKEEAAEGASAAFASVRLLAPAAVLRKIRAIEHLGDEHGPTSPEFLGAMDRLTAVLRKDLGLDSDDDEPSQDL